MRTSESFEIIYTGAVMKHMKWYLSSYPILEHGDDNRQKFEQEYVAIKDTFQFELVFMSLGMKMPTFTSRMSEKIVCISCYEVCR